MADEFSELIGAAEKNQQFNIGASINWDDYPPIKCDKCGGIVFITGMAIRELPGILLGKGAEPQYIPQSALVCAKCGELFKKDREFFKVGEYEKQGPENLQL